MTATQVADTDRELEYVLRKIEAEPVESVRSRERNAFDNVAGPFHERLVLFGAGPLGRGILAGLRNVGVEPLGFADNNQKLWGTEVSGLRVLSPNEAVETYGDTACFVVTIYQGSSVRRQLTNLGCRRIAHFAALVWKYADTFIPQSGLQLPHRMVEQIESIRKCYVALADDASKTELCEQLRWRYWLENAPLSAPDDSRDTYFPMDLLSPSAGEIFVDCGAFDGDTIRSFNEHWKGAFRHIFALEPDPTNRAALSANIDATGIGSRVTVMPYAVGS